MRIFALVILSCVLTIGSVSSQASGIGDALSAHSIKIGNLQLKLKQQQEEDKQSRITIDVQYPYLDVSAAGKPAQNFNDIIDDIIETETGQFRATVDEVHRDDNLENLPNHGYSDIKIRYKILLLTKGSAPLISILFTIDTYISGAAHPNLTHRTLNYDFASGDAIAIAMLFKNKPDFVPVLNKYCAQQLTKLTKKSEREMVADNEINYSQWNLTSKGILVTFDEFPHVYGLVQVLIPYAAMDKVLSSPSITLRLNE